MIPTSWLYRNRRPTWLARIATRFWCWLCSLGLLPPTLVTLETRGRRSGRPHLIPVVAPEYQGSRYLVSMLGDGVDWVRNIRAAGGAAFIRHGRRRKVRLEEVPVEQRAPIIKAYLEPATSARRHFEISWKAELEEFERIAGRYPVFRIVEGAD